ncbi:hypothetical protein BHM03_00029038 [Ensete ventricosum]|nr:hypothetical protein BHM03_00029038 [Ensete ventricosum]
MRIMYTRTVLRISRIHRGRIVIFSKGFPNSSFPLCAAVVAVAAAPTQAAVALARWQPPCQGATTRAAGGIPMWAPTTGPLCGHRAASDYRPYGLAAVGRARGRLSPLRASLASLSGWPWPRPSREWSALHGGWSWLAAPPPRCLRYENAARTRRTILCDTISSHAV